MPALTRLMAQLPATLPAAMLVVQHLAPDSTGEPLVARLASHTALRCQLATDHVPLRAGHLYLAPPNRHLLVKADHLRVTQSPHENNYRPAADTLFRSAAVAFDSHVVGVVLTGMLHDGTAGLDFIKRCGGGSRGARPRRSRICQYARERPAPRRNRLRGRARRDGAAAGRPGKPYPPFSY